MTKTRTWKGPRANLQNLERKEAEKIMSGYQVRDYFTEEEHEALVRFGDEFSDRLGLLVADITSRFPEEVEHSVLAYLQDRCSIYGTRYDEYLKELRYD